MDILKTKIGEYHKGEPIAVRMTTYCGRTYTYKGTLEDVRWCRGKELLVMKSNSDGRLYDVSLEGNVQIMTGQEALNAVEE